MASADHHSYLKVWDWSSAWEQNLVCVCACVCVCVCVAPIFGALSIHLLCFWLQYPKPNFYFLTRWSGAWTLAPITWLEMWANLQLLSSSGDRTDIFVHVTPLKQVTNMTSTYSLHVMVLGCSSIPKVSCFTFHFLSLFYSCPISLYTCLIHQSFSV